MLIKLNFKIDSEKHKCSQQPKLYLTRDAVKYHNVHNLSKPQCSKKVKNCHRTNKDHEGNVRHFRKRTLMEGFQHICNNKIREIRN